MSALARFTSFDPRPAGGAVRHWLHRLGRRARVRPPRTGEPVLRTGPLARRRERRLAWRVGLMVCAAAGLSAGGLEAAAGLLAARDPASQALAARAAPQRWTEIVRPIALYDLAGTDFSKLPAGYRARRRGADGPREDVMTFGNLGTPRPFLQLTLLRVGAEAEASDDGLADGLARLAGTRGLTATRIRPGVPVDTRLGRFEAADLLLWDGGATTPCLGFRGPGAGGTVLRVSGFACGTPDRPLGRAALACVLDRLDLVSAGDDGPLRAVFVAAERRSAATCLTSPSSASPGSLVANRRRLGWLDPEGEMPPLRGLFEATIRRR